MTIKEIRSLTGLSAQKFGDKYNIPLRTIQNWEGGARKAPEYILTLLERVVREDEKIKDLTPQQLKFLKDMFEFVHDEL